MYFKCGFIHFASYVVHLVKSLQRLTFRNGGSITQISIVCQVNYMSTHSSLTPISVTKRHKEHLTAGAPKGYISNISHRPQCTFIHFVPYVVHLVESLQRLVFRNGGSTM